MLRIEEAKQQQETLKPRDTKNTISFSQLAAFVADKLRLEAICYELHVEFAMLIDKKLPRGSPDEFSNLPPGTKCLLILVCNWTQTDPDTTRIRWISSNHLAASRKTRLMTPPCSPIEFVRRKDPPLASLRDPISVLISQPEKGNI